MTSSRWQMRGQGRARENQFPCCYGEFRKPVGIQGKVSSRCLVALDLEQRDQDPAAINLGVVTVPKACKACGGPAHPGSGHRQMQTDFETLACSASQGNRSHLKWFCRGCCPGSQPCLVAGVCGHSWAELSLGKVSVAWQDVEGAGRERVREREHSFGLLSPSLHSGIIAASRGKLGAFLPAFPKYPHPA